MGHSFPKAKHVFSVFLVRVWHETLCGQAEKTIKAPEIKHSIILPHFSVKALESGSLNEKLFWKKRFVLWAGFPPLYMKYVLLTSDWAQSIDGTTQRPEAEWNLCTLLFQFQFQYGRQLSNETRDRRPVKTCVLFGKSMGNSSSKLTKAICHLTSVISHDITVSVFTYSWLPERKRFAFGVRPCYFFQSRLSKEDPGHTIHIRWSLFPFSFFFSENWASLQILVRWKCCSTTGTLCPRKSAR